MTSSLIPENPLIVSPSLAATIGLEEAVMLQGLHERVRFKRGTVIDGYKWFNVERALLEELFPFWPAGDIQRIATSLRDKGIIVLAADSYLVSEQLQFALNEKVVSAVISPSPTAAPSTPSQPQTQVRAEPSSSRGRKISPDWRPDPEILKQLQQSHGIPVSFVEEKLPEFIVYWQERNEAHHSWNALLRKWVIERWRKEETLFAARERAEEIAGNWRPSEDALEILQRLGISDNFIEDAIPEFVLYWREQGDSSTTWNSKFVQHIKHQWARYCQTLEYDTEPKPINKDWQPSADAYDILRMANIDLDFARSLIPEFVIFWFDSKQLHHSWNSKFLQHVKYHWARRHQLQVDDNRGKTAEQDFVKLHTDRSWADGL